MIIIAFDLLYRPLIRTLFVYKSMMEIETSCCPQQNNSEMRIEQLQTQC